MPRVNAASHLLFRSFASFRGSVACRSSASRSSPRCFLVATMLLLDAFCGCGLTGYGGHATSLRHHIYHRVQPQETLASIGRRYHVAYESLALLNGLRDPSAIEVGQLLLVRYSDERVKEELQRARASQTSTAALRGAQGGRLGWPVGGGRIVSEFGPRGSSFHDGLDIAAPSGTPIYAAHPGQVAYSADGLGGYGKLIVLKSRTTLMTVYAHNSKMFVREGDTVQRGQKIAEVGQTGHASGPHLHFEVRTKDRAGRYVAIDPLPLVDNSSSGRPRFRVNESLTPLLARLTPWR